MSRRWHTRRATQAVERPNCTGTPASDAYARLWGISSAHTESAADGPTHRDVALQRRYSGGRHDRAIKTCAPAGGHHPFQMIPAPVERASSPGDAELPPPDAFSK